jgi:hypothetical protein
MCCRLTSFGWRDITQPVVQPIPWPISFKIITPVQNYYFCKQPIRFLLISISVLFLTGESFLYFDYGPAENLERYGTTYPPEYNLTQVTVPVYLVHADNDPFAPNEVCVANIIFYRLYYSKFWFHYFLNRTWLGWSRDWVTWKPLFGWTVLRSVTEILYGHLAWLNWFTFRLSICYRHLSPTRNPFRWSRMRITSYWESLDCELLVTSRIQQSHLNFPPYLLLLLHTRIKFYQI